MSCVFGAELRDGRLGWNAFIRRPLRAESGLRELYALDGIRTADKLVVTLRFSARRLCQLLKVPFSNHERATVHNRAEQRVQTLALLIIVDKLAYCCSHDIMEDRMISAELGKQLESYIQQLVDTGRYGSKSEVLREGVRLVQDRETRLAALDASVMRGIADADAGRTKPASDVFDRLETKYSGIADKAEKSV